MHSVPNLTCTLTLRAVCCGAAETFAVQEKNVEEHLHFSSGMSMKLLRPCRRRPCGEVRWFLHLEGRLTRTDSCTVS